jgi:hypothetical protein
MNIVSPKTLVIIISVISFVLATLYICTDGRHLTPSWIEPHLPNIREWVSSEPETSSENPVLKAKQQGKDFRAPYDPRGGFFASSAKRLETTVKSTSRSILDSIGAKWSELVIPKKPTNNKYENDDRRRRVRVVAKDISHGDIIEEIDKEERFPLSSLSMSKATVFVDDSRDSIIAGDVLRSVILRYGGDASCFHRDATIADSGYKVDALYDDGRHRVAVITGRPELATYPNGVHYSREEYEKEILDESEMSASIFRNYGVLRIVIPYSIGRRYILANGGQWEETVRDELTRREMIDRYIHLSLMRYYRAIQ